MVDLENLMNSASALGQNKYALIGGFIIFSLILGIGFIALGPENELAGSTAKSKERIVKLQGEDREVSVVLGGGACGCSTDYFPVCGSDGRTYWNECFANCLETTIDHQGICAGQTTTVTTTVTTPGIVTTVQQIVNIVPEGSVCGDTVDGFNRCEEGAQCIDETCQGVDGVNCNGRIIPLEEYNRNPVACARSGGCGTNINPVCAENRYTYANLCEAEKAGYETTDLTPGACSSGGMCPAANQPCGITYSIIEDGELNTWHDANACCGSLTCENGICKGTNSFCPDGRKITSPLELASSCYPTQTRIVTSSGSSCPAIPVCPTTVTPPETGDAVSASFCEDTDTNIVPSGLDPNQQGTASGKNRQGETVSEIDSCITTETVREYYCGTNGSSIFVTSEKINCDEGKTCVNGACVPKNETLLEKETSCRESDFGIDLTKKGVTTAKFINGNTAIKIDSCRANEIVSEWYCSGKRIANVYRSCPVGQTCTEGSCRLIGVRQIPQDKIVLPGTTYIIDDDKTIEIKSDSIETIREGQVIVKIDPHTEDKVTLPSNVVTIMGNKVTIKPDISKQLEGDKLVIGLPSTNVVSAAISNIASSSGAASSTSGLTCNDNDSPTKNVDGIILTGGDANFKGSLTLVSGTQTMPREDTCNGLKQVIQYYCGEGAILVGKTVDSCTSGTACQNGACVTYAATGITATVIENKVYPKTVIDSSQVTSATNIVGANANDLTKTTTLNNAAVTSCPTGFTLTNEKCINSNNKEIGSWVAVQMPIDTTTADKIQAKVTGQPGDKISIYTEQTGTNNWKPIGTCILVSTTTTCNANIPSDSNGQKILIGLDATTSNSVTINQISETTTSRATATGTSDSQTPTIRTSTTVSTTTEGASQTTPSAGGASSTTSGTTTQTKVYPSSVVGSSKATDTGNLVGSAETPNKAIVGTTLDKDTSFGLICPTGFTATAGTCVHSSKTSIKGWVSVDMTGSSSDNSDRDAVEVFISGGTNGDSVQIYGANTAGSGWVVATAPCTLQNLDTTCQVQLPNYVDLDRLLIGVSSNAVNDVVVRSVALVNN